MEGNKIRGKNERRFSLTHFFASQVARAYDELGQKTRRRRYAKTEGKNEMEEK